MIIQPIPKAKLITAPAELAVSLSLLKQNLRVDSTDEDALITVILKAAIEKIEKLTSKKLINQTWDIFFDNFPCDRKADWWDGTKEAPISQLVSQYSKLELPFGILSSVTGVYTYDNDNTEYIFASSNYVVDTCGLIGSISLKSNSSWPTTILKPTNGIKVTCVFGYGADDTYIPNDLVMAVLALASRMYEHRGDELPQIPPEVLTLISPYEKIRI